MLNYIAKRVFTSIITIFVVISLTFVLMHKIPGGPFDGEKKLPPQVEANLKQKFGLDKPPHEQYVMYLKNLSHGDLGPSMSYDGMTVNDVIGYSFPASAKLGVVSVIFALIVGLYLGITAALKQGKWQDSVTMIIATLGVTVPSFVLATFLIYIFALKLGWFPVIGFDGPQNYVLPVIALGGYSMAFIARLGRSSFLDVVRQDYMRTAKAKGLSRSTVIYKHGLRNALIPVITYIGPLVAGILTGSFVVESLFGIPGLGGEFVRSITNRDYTTILGVTVFYSTFLIICNLVVDILYGIIDPRIKLED